jgi:3-methyladenine DNA glycosylase AlkD
VDWNVESVVAELKKLSSKRVRDGMARYGLPSEKALGVAVGDIRDLGKRIGHDHALALGIWKTDIYEARMVAAFLGDPERITPAQMDRWCRDFDNWGICDTLCFHLFNKTSHAWAKVEQWSDDKREFVKRAAFALLASLAGHDKSAADEQFLRTFSLIERAATDERNFVKKGVSWALRGIGHRNRELNAAARELASSLSKSENATARWIGKDTLRDITRPAMLKRLDARAGRTTR